MSNLIKKIQNAIFRQELFAKKSGIVVAVSGGPDSACLLDILARLKKKYELNLIIAHVNYGLRGQDSARDEKFVFQLAEKYHLPLEILRVSVKDKSDLENRLRDIRYDFFETIRKENNFDQVAVAHNLDDQAETFLMRLLRGAGLTGLSAMKYKNEKIVRPLLGVSRQEILDYLQKNKLSYRIDKTNLETVFFRNKIRHELIPKLEKFNPQIKKTLFNATFSIGEDLSLLEELAEKAYRKNQPLSASRLLKLHPALQRRVLLRLIAEKKPGLKNIESVHIEELLKALRSTKNKTQIVVFKGLKMIRKSDKMTLTDK